MKAFLNNLKLLKECIRAGYHVASAMWQQRHTNYIADFQLIIAENDWEFALADEMLKRHDDEKGALIDRFEAHRKQREELQDVH